MNKNQRHEMWCMILNDLNELNPYVDKEDDPRFPIERKIHDIFYKLNSKYKETCGKITPSKTLLLMKGGEFEYTLYFRAEGGDLKGFSKEMFNHKATKKMKGFQEFDLRKLQIIKTHKGKAAYPAFIERLKLNDYEKMNEATKSLAVNFTKKLADIKKRP